RMVAMDLSSIELNSPVVEVRGLARRVPVSDGELTILEDTWLPVGRGESAAIVGASGSGTSPLLGLLAGLDVPSEGGVTVAGTSMFELDEDARAALRAANISFVFQSFRLLPALTALEYVMLPLELSGTADAQAVATQWLDRVGLSAR